MPEPKYNIGSLVKLDTGLYATVQRISWDGECWSYECVWYHDAEVRTCEFSHFMLEEA